MRRRESGRVSVTRQRRSFGRIRKCQPSGRYQASYVGPDDRLHKAPETFAAKVDAEGWLTDRRREIDRELWSPPATQEQKRTKKAAEVRFEDYAKSWVTKRTVKGRPLRPRTVEHYGTLLRDHINPTFGKKAMRDISMESVDRWHDKVAKTAPTTRAHAYGLLRTILETARTRDGLIDSNPCLIRGAGTTERKIKPKPATLDELASIVEAMPERFQPMVLLAAWCALREGELFELRRRDVNLQDGVVSITRAVVRVKGGFQVGPPKSDAGIRDVAMPAAILPKLKAHMESEYMAAGDDALLFPATAGGHLQPSTLYRHYYKARSAAKRTDLRFHDLRHTGATMAAQMGATLAELMVRVGHSTPHAAMRYQHAAQGRDALIAAKMSELIQGTAEGRKRVTLHPNQARSYPLG
ncbi:site-specific integrase [Mycobacterium sp. 236(2023)]|uniref:tyrosine-type recombinase/integrase n=1 Tax=Mycobacterium sp. 236(2023) TaxID=3038163 RepID=UPI0024158DE8|nr:site-specific integrase [Mycobacterium sp. 236(2023)]MDG4665138.1 tyrosine-type recombinase/integrase [Mycobacterium sp. 236(2023)]